MFAPSLEVAYRSLADRVDHVLTRPLFLLLHPFLLEIRYMFQTLYSHIDSYYHPRFGRHAVRRSAFFAITWSALHYSLVFSNVTLAVAFGVRAKVLLTSNAEPNQVRSLAQALYGGLWNRQKATTVRGETKPVQNPDSLQYNLTRQTGFYFGSLAVIEMSLSLISLCHKSGAPRWSKVARLFIRSAMSIGAVFFIRNNVGNLSKWATSDALVATTLLLQVVIEYIITRLEWGFVEQKCESTPEAEEGGTSQLDGDDSDVELFGGAEPMNGLVTALSCRHPWRGVSDTED